MNDIGNDSDFLYSILYADGTTSVLLNGKYYSDLIKLLNSKLDKLSNWLSADKLSVNFKKSYYMVFHRAKLKIDKHAAINPCSAEYLRLFFASQLNIWEPFSEPFFYYIAQLLIY